MITTAPGKLFLIGEYAVLNGAPAVLVPVPQRASATLDHDGQNQLITISINRKCQTMEQGLSRESLPKAVITTLDCADRLKDTTLTLDTRPFFWEQNKLGIGSSAALTAALVKLLIPEEDATHQLAQAMASHRLFQDGKGSGADVALSMTDAPIRFQSGQAPEPFALPDDLHMLAIWSGTPASTTDFISRLDAWRPEQQARFDHHIGRLSETTTTFTAATDTDQLLTIIHQYDRYLDEFSKESGLNFYNQPHLELRKEVELARCVYKPSGAGGGDFGIAFSADKNELIILAEKMEKEGRMSFFLSHSS